jgi:PAS domain S-box-containing protein
VTKDDAMLLAWLNRWRTSSSISPLMGAKADASESSSTISHHDLNTLLALPANTSDFWIAIIAFLIGIIALLLSDIARRKRAERDLRDSEEKYRSVFETSNDAIMIFDTDGNVIDVNPKMLELSGRTLGEVRQLGIAAVGTDIMAYTADEARARHQKTLREGPQVFEWQAKNKAGSPG